MNLQPTMHQLSVLATCTTPLALSERYHRKRQPTTPGRNLDTQVKTRTTSRSNQQILMAIVEDDFGAQKAICQRHYWNELHWVSERHCTSCNRGCRNSLCERILRGYPDHHQGVSACQSWHRTLLHPTPELPQPLPTALEKLVKVCLSSTQLITFFTNQVARK
jgi:hypothetical protein